MSSRTACVAMLLGGWSSSLSIGGIVGPGPSGHYYEVVQAPGITWSEANNNAVTSTSGCLQGHLATITTLQEDQYLYGLTKAIGECWVGGYQDPADELDAKKGWTWVNNEGPIAGINGGITYANWQTVPWLLPEDPLYHEPNDWYGPGTEQYLAISLRNEFGWNDEGSSGNVQGYVVEYEDVEPPIVSCVPGTNPAGKNVPNAGKNQKSGQNPDGFYELLAVDNCDPEPRIFVGDTASDFVTGPFQSGDKVKITQAPGVTPNSKAMAGVIVAHIQLKGDAQVYAIDSSGNVSVTASCMVPPAPK